LDEDRPVADQRIAAAVIKVQVTVGHITNLIQADANIREGGHQLATTRAVVRIDLGM
jgi:hypothetical protein